MMQFYLTLTNLNNRPYIHGTSIVKGVLDSLTSEYSKIYDFEIRLKSKLMYQPIMCISKEQFNHPSAVVTGSFMFNEYKYWFYLTQSANICTNILQIDEQELSSRVYEDNDAWSLDMLSTDDIHVSLNEVSKLSNQFLFAAQPGIIMSPDKQTWFVGYKLPDIEFLKISQPKISVSKGYEMLTSVCMKRQIIMNDKIVGDRICIYA